MSAPNPIDNAEIFDVLLVGGVRSPGQVTLSGHSREQKWDVKEGDGQGGATVTYKGEQLAKFTATFELWDEPAKGVDQFTEWESFLPTLRKSAEAAEPTALDVYHPDLAALDIKSVVVAKLGGMSHDGKGKATVTVDFLEYRPPVPKGGTPSGSSANAGTTGNQGGAGAPPDPNQDVKDEIDKELAEAQEP